MPYCASKRKNKTKYSPSFYRLFTYSGHITHRHYVSPKEVFYQHSKAIILSIYKCACTQ